PGIAPELVGRGDIQLDVDGGLLRLKEILALSADAKGVVGRLGLPRDPHAVLVHDLAVLLGEALAVIDVPAELGKHRVDEVNPQGRLVIVWRPNAVGLMVEAINELQNDFGAFRHIGGNNNRRGPAFKPDRLLPIRASMRKADRLAWPG